MPPTANTQIERLLLDQDLDPSVEPSDDVVYIDTSNSSRELRKALRQIDGGIEIFLMGEVAPCTLEDVHNRFSFKYCLNVSDGLIIRDYLKELRESK